MWCNALGYIIQGLLNSHTQTFNFATALIFSVLPLMIAYDAAKASSKCTALTNALNHTRKKHPNVNASSKIAVLQEILDHENAGQGLGVSNRPTCTIMY